MTYLIGYVSIILANRFRILIIAIAGYIHSPSGIIEYVRIYVGWIVFVLLMEVFWIVFFARILYFNPPVLLKKDD